MKNNIDGHEFLIKHQIHTRIMNFKEIEYKNNPDDEDYEWKIKMIRSNIPREFWHIEFKNFWGNSEKLKIVKKYCNKMRSAKEHGFGFLFSGDNGVGKTSIMMLILKEALRNGYSALYITMPMIFKQIYLNYNFPSIGKELNDIMRTIDFLAIGELGKDYHRKDSSEFARAEFDCLFRSRREECLPVIMDTNMAKEELEDTYGDSLMSLFKSRLRFITMTGTDYRVRVQKKEWKEIIG